MVARGIRKMLNNDLEAQKASVAKAEAKRRAELDKQRLRFSISWYDIKTDAWFEFECKKTSNGISTTFDTHSEVPFRPLKLWTVASHVTGERLPVEAGFIGDGLQHCVWISGVQLEFGKRGQWPREVFGTPESKTKTHGELVTGIGRLPYLFYELYGIRVSIPMIQRSVRVYNDSQKG